jgi:hypothetical protein
VLAVLPVIAGFVVLGDYYRIALCGSALAAAAAVCVMLNRENDELGTFNLIDWGILLVTAFEIPSLAMSYYRENSSYWSAGLLFAVVVYFLIRMSLRSHGQAVVLSMVFTVFGVLISVPALSRFSTKLDGLHAAGFRGVVPFREKLAIGSGYVGGEWFTIILLTAPYALLLATLAFSKRRRLLGVFATVPVVVIATELAATCSRAVFSAFVVGLVVLTATSVAYRLISWKTGSTLLASSLLVLALILLIGNVALPGLASCYVARDTSQSRSAEGRVVIWRSAIDSTHESRLWGIGSGNAGFLLASHAEGNASTAFAARTFSLPVEILVEKGVVGAACYGILILAVLFELHRTLRMQGLDISARWIAVVAFSGIVMGLFRDLTYSSLTAHRITFALFFSLVGMLSAAKDVKSSEALLDKVHRRRNKL